MSAVDPIAPDISRRLPTLPTTPDAIISLPTPPTLGDGNSKFHNTSEIPDVVYALIEIRTSFGDHVILKMSN